MMLGADPELFLRNSAGKLVSAIGIVQGTKKNPLPIKELGKGFFMQQDNVLLEYNIPPAKSVGHWGEYHSKILKYLANKMKEKGLVLSFEASNEMPDEELAAPEAHLFGCEADFNVWTLSVNPKPRAKNPNLRSGGGHVHISFNGTKIEKILLARRLDAYLGLWSVINDPDQRRKELYGKAGAIRFKPYGIEYRVLSNFWVATPALQEEVWRLCSMALRSSFIPKEDVRIAIDSANVEMAKEIWNGL